MSSPPVAVPAGPHPPPRPSALPSSRYRHPGDVIRLISAGLLLVGAFAAAAVVVVAATLRRRRFRLLAGLAAGAVAAAGLTAGILALLGTERPATLTANQASGGWLASTAFRAPALLAAAVAVVVAAAPWLSRPWRRAAWLALLLAATARLLAGAVLPAELILALTAGVTAGAAVLVKLGVPDRRIGPDGI